MKTIKEIETCLKAATKVEPWIKALETDERTGVKNALKRWWKQYEKREQLLESFQQKKEFDQSYEPFKGALVAGVDEAGRGPLAGPVVTAAVILPANVEEFVGVDDSKKISKSDREQLAHLIREKAVSYAVHIQSAKNIDELNIYQATRVSMEKAVDQLPVQPDIVIADAMQLKTVCPSVSIVKGDAKSLAIAAASLLAKTTRDAIMDELHERYPMYLFKKNAGYGTPDHLEALHTYGPCPEHRKTFEPVKSIVQKEEIRYELHN